MRRIPLLAALAWLLLGGEGRRPAHAQEPMAVAERESIADAARFRLDLRAGVSVRNDTLTTGSARIGARGTALSDLVLGGAWFSGRSPIGVAGRFELDRFALRADAASAGDGVAATGLELHAAAAGRLHPGDGQVLLEGQVGYGFLQVPLGRLPGSDGALPPSTDTLRAHGPV